MSPGAQLHFLGPAFHLGGNTGNIGNTSSRATLQPLHCFLDCPTLQSHWGVSIWAHTERLNCCSDSRPVLLTILQLIHFHLELPRHRYLSLGADCCSSRFVTGSTCVLWPWVSWVQDRFSLPFAERVHIWICPSNDCRTSGTELFGALSLRSVVWCQ